MAKKILFSLLTILMIALPLLTGCNGTDATPSATTSTPAATTSAPTAATNWWDEFGEPQYGGVINMHLPLDTFMSFDPAQMMGNFGPHLEGLFYRDWTVDRDTEPLLTEFVPVEYYNGGLAESWEQTDPFTVVVNIQQGVKWQNKPPLNGRELTAYDVEYTYDRIQGTGHGFTEPNMFFASANIEKVTATDEYTVEFKLKSSSSFGIYDVFGGGFLNIAIVAPEWVALDDSSDNDALGGSALNNWENAIGTGAWIITDRVQGTSTTFSRNSDYWGHDERHPGNQLPYIDEIHYVVISDMSTAVSAMRTGKIDTIGIAGGAVPVTYAVTLAETNPEILQYWWPESGYCLEMRCDQEPFTDIRVRKALQMSINRELIAESHYFGLVDGTPAGLITPLLKDYAYGYEDWSEELKEEYSFNQEKAKELLAETQWAGGFETNCIAQAAEDVELLEIVKAYFMEIGVDMEIIPFAGMEFFDYAREGKNNQMTWIKQTAMPRPPLYAISMRTAGNSDNYTHIDDPEYNALYKQASSATTIDEAARFIKEADKYALEQHWAINICPRVTPAMVQPWIKGYSGERTFSGVDAYYMARWWIDSEVKASLTD